MTLYIYNTIMHTTQRSMHGSMVTKVTSLHARRFLLVTFSRDILSSSSVYSRRSWKMHSGLP